MLGINGSTVKARRALRKLDKKAYDQGALGVTGNAYVQAKERSKESAVTPAFSAETYKGEHYVS